MHRRQLHRVLPLLFSVGLACSAQSSPPADNGGADVTDVDVTDIDVDDEGDGDEAGGDGDAGSDPTPADPVADPIAAVLMRNLDLVICEPAVDPWNHFMEMSPTTTRYQSCAAVCSDWRACTTETVARGRAQLELAFVVDEDGQGRGFGGTLRFTRDGARDRVVLFHKGGAGTEYVEDDLPERVESAGGTYVEPKWVAEVDTAVGWFSRPFAESRLEKNLYGVTLRPAAVMKWLYLNLATDKLSTVGCSGGSIATYYPRHWHGLDVILRYQLVSGGPVMAKIQAACGSTDVGLGRCTIDPTTVCTSGPECGPDGGTCSPYEWKDPNLIMEAVRGTIDHLHANATGGSSDCDDGTPQPAFDASDFVDSPLHTSDSLNEHRIDFMTNLGAIGADDALNVVASEAAIYSALAGEKSWTVQTSGIHCDSFKTDAAWELLRVGAGLE